ncbi:hypothetical protein [Taibaiella sp. KBW10]|uniref:hypothetical protein n=1 Tax=Taibaiella sp. KBW10 TaxID=2153357 RepID=UPI000F5A2E08|nr:hypothetical protein [Taibaiella sp. KBW10]
MKPVMKIAEPCHENWNDMTPNATGRHCALCNKTVVDFTNWETDDIRQYITNNANTCGQMSVDQLQEESIQPVAFLPEIVRSSLPYWKKIAAVVVLFFSLASCANAQEPLGEVAPVKVDTPKADTIRPMILGKIICPPKTTDIKIPVVDTITPVMRGEITIEPAPRPPVKKTIQKKK